MEITEVEERVIAAAASRSGVAASEISADSRLCEDLGFDSLAAVEFVLEMEDEFAIDIDYQDAESVSTIRQAIELVERKIAPGEGRRAPVTAGRARPVACTSCSWRGERIDARPKRCPACGGFVNYR